MGIFWTNDERRTARHPPDHRHHCDHDCGAYYVCTRRDGCDRKVWTCPACADDDLDAYITQLERDTSKEI